MQAVKQDTKHSKSEDRILVLATWRMYLFAVKVPTKVEVTFNFLEIRAMNTYPDHQVVIDTDKSTHSLRLQSQDHLDHMMNHINFALSRIFNNSMYAPTICRAEGDVSDGVLQFSPNSESSVETQKTCGGFSETYAALCDYNGIGCKEEVQWDVDTIYHSQDNREFNLLDFSHLDSRYTTCSGSEVVEQVLHTVSKSSSLEELTLENAGLKSDFPQKMATALSENPASAIHSLNLAHNTLDNQGVSNLIQLVCRLNKGLRLLNLSKTSLSSKGVVSLSQALCSSDDYSNSLLHLDLSKNPGILSGEEATNMYLFLAQPNCLVHLDLSGTDCTVDSLFGALLRGCCADLSYLNISKNCFSHRALFLGLSSNPHISDLHLDISGWLDTDLLGVIPAFSRHPSLKHLLLGKNFNIKGRVLDEILQKLVQLVQEEECALQSLSLADSRLRSRGTVLVNALGSNTCLRKVDLSGNSLEDAGAKMLSKALQINTTLRSVTWDRNNTTATGFQDVARALEHNFTLQYMAIPLSDVTQAYRSAPEKIDQALTKIQRALLRNNQTQRFSQKQSLRLHQGLVTSTAEQVMERLCVRVQQQVIVDSMVSLCRELCPMSSSAAERLNPPLSSISERVSIPRSTIRTALMERAAQDVNRALETSDLFNLSFIFPLSHTSEHSLRPDQFPPVYSILCQVSQVKRWDGAGTDRRTIRNFRITDSLDFPDEEGLGMNIDTIAIKKRSSRTRRIRPVSTRLRHFMWINMNLTQRLSPLPPLGLGDDPTSSPPPSAPSHSAPLSCSSSWEGLSTLPTQGAPLRHVTQVRPRPPRRHCRGQVPLETYCSENGGVNMLEDGLPDFYTKRVLPDSQLSLLHQAQSLRRKKRRSVLSIFSGFRKNRNSTISNQETDSGSENVYSMIQHPKDPGKGEAIIEVGANGRMMPSPRPIQGTPLPGMRGARPSPHSLTQRQPSDLVGMVYSCIAAEDEDSDSSFEIRPVGRDTNRQKDRQTASDTKTETHANGHAMSSASLTDKQADIQTDKQTNRQTEPVSQDLPMPSAQTDTQTEVDRGTKGTEGTESMEDRQESAHCGQKPEPPSQSSKPSLASIRQRHLQGSSDEGTNEKKSIPPVPPASTKPVFESPDRADCQDEEGGRNGYPLKLHRNRKADTIDMGMERDSPNDLKTGSSDRKPPVKKPRLPQNRNRSLDYPRTVCMYLLLWTPLCVILYEYVKACPESPEPANDNGKTSS
ncbi:unnamed protein product, partial [Coregonus sp. 'balchen']